MCQVYRTYDAYLIRAILNHPDIYSGFVGSNEMDLRVDENIYLWTECGLFPCTPMGDKINCHSAILPEFRGSLGVKAGKMVMKWIKDNTDMTVFTQVLRCNKKAQAYNYLVGLRRVGGDAKHIFYEG